MVTVNNVHPFGVIISFPKLFSGETDEEDDRLKWYGNAVYKDFIMSASVRQSVVYHTYYNYILFIGGQPPRSPPNHLHSGY